MSIEIVADLEQIEVHSPEWHELRKLGVGGSDAGAVCGFSRFRTPYQVWAEKVSPVVPDEDDENEPQLWGKLLEPVVREEFTRRTGIQVHPFPRMVRNSERPYMLANVDGLTGPAQSLTGAYEGKTTRRSDLWPVADDGTVQVPFDNMVQGMHYLAVLELERIYFACLVGGQTLRIAEVEVNPQLVEDLIAIEAAFWQSVLDRNPPEVSAQDVSVLRSRWDAEAGKRIELSGTHHTNLKVRAKYKTQIKDTQEKIDQIDAEIMAFMGDAEEAVFNGQTVVTWRTDKRGRVDGTALAAAHPEIADEFRKPPGRRFLPKEITE
jgi:putative phage-type endonuclease